MTHRTATTSLLRGRVTLLQPEKGFRAGLDTVFLAASVTAKKGQHILDVGCGVGSAGLCALARLPDGVQLTGLDAQSDMIALAEQNAENNGVAGRCRFVSGNLKTERQVPDNAFHAVMMNPPYQEDGTHLRSAHTGKAMARDEGGTGATLENWIKYTHKKLKQGGMLSIVHRADRLDDIILHLTKRRWFGTIAIYPLWPRKGENAKRVIIRARKERYAPIVLHAGIILHQKNGNYTTAAKKVLEAAEALDFIKDEGSY
ncbi:MAG: methyltransferase [Alphaproteobacteria bacterium]|nr:methyltransferase [Alphaproteobacteria bacterium]